MPNRSTSQEPCGDASADALLVFDGVTPEIAAAVVAAVTVGLRGGPPLLALLGILAACGFAGSLISNSFCAAHVHSSKLCDNTMR